MCDMFEADRLDTAHIRKVEDLKKQILEAREYKQDKVNEQSEEIRILKAELARLRKETIKEEETKLSNKEHRNAGDNNNRMPHRNPVKKEEAGVLDNGLAKVNS